MNKKINGQHLKKGRTELKIYLFSDSAIITKVCLRNSKKSVQPKRFLKHIRYEDLLELTVKTVNN